MTSGTRVEPRRGGYSIRQEKGMSTAGSHVYEYEDAWGISAGRLSEARSGTHYEEVEVDEGVVAVFSSGTPPVVVERYYLKAAYDNLPAAWLYHQGLRVRLAPPTAGLPLPERIHTELDAVDHPLPCPPICPHPPSRKRYDPAMVQHPPDEWATWAVVLGGLVSGPDIPRLLRQPLPPGFLLQIQGAIQQQRGVTACVVGNRLYRADDFAKLRRWETFAPAVQEQAASGDPRIIFTDRQAPGMRNLRLPCGDGAAALEPLCLCLVLLWPIAVHTWRGRHSLGPTLLPATPLARLPVTLDLQDTSLQIYPVLYHHCYLPGMVREVLDGMKAGINALQRPYLTHYSPAGGR